MCFINEELPEVDDKRKRMDATIWAKVDYYFKKDLEKMARSRHVSLSALVRDLLRRGLENDR